MSSIPRKTKFALAMTTCMCLQARSCIAQSAQKNHLDLTNLHLKKKKKEPEQKKLQFRCVCCVRHPPPSHAYKSVLKRLFEYSNIFEQGFENEYSNTKIENRVFEKAMNRAPSPTLTAASHHCVSRAAK